MQPKSSPEEQVFLEHSEIPLRHTHADVDCILDDRCTLHKRTKHHMRSFPQVWNKKYQIVERVCVHGIGHTDPDELPGLEIHVCDGCCAGVDLLTEGFIPAPWAASGLIILDAVLSDQTLGEYKSTGTYENNIFSLAEVEEGFKKEFSFKNLGLIIRWDNHKYETLAANTNALNSTHWYLLINACIQSLRTV